MSVTIDIEGECWTMVSCYAPEVGCDDDKLSFWRDLDSVVQGIEDGERIVIAGDINGHVGWRGVGYEGVHGGHGIGNVNQEGIAILDFATAYEMKLVNTKFTKIPNHLVTYNSGGHQSLIDYIMVQKKFVKEAIDCKTLPLEQVTGQHRTLVMKMKIRERRKRWEKVSRKVRWWKLKDRNIREEFQAEMDRILDGVAFEDEEGQKDIFRIAAERDKKSKDIGQVVTVKSEDGRILMDEEDI
ncbi:uncharacterized protein LOC134774438 [Penaeus indicus]|uniref:uncharacterized protein LOC134774438 n=1 Tax=Penaeus indicus TaxID=29960 RepID=UPI00300C598D